MDSNKNPVSSTKIDQSSLYLSNSVDTKNKVINSNRANFRINFTNTDFGLTQVSNYATFTKGVIGQKQLSKTGQVITIRNLASFTIISEVNFYLSNIDFPYSAKPQSLSVVI